MVDVAGLRRQSAGSQAVAETRRLRPQISFAQLDRISDLASSKVFVESAGQRSAHLKKERSFMESFGGVAAGCVGQLRQAGSWLPMRFLLPELSDSYRLRTDDGTS